MRNRARETPASRSSIRPRSSMRRLTTPFSRMVAFGCFASSRSSRSSMLRMCSRCRLTRSGRRIVPQPAVGGSKRDSGSDFGPPVERDSWFGRPPPQDKQAPTASATSVVDTSDLVAPRRSALLYRHIGGNSPDAYVMQVTVKSPRRARHSPDTAPDTTPSTTCAKAGPCRGAGHRCIDRSGAVRTRTAPYVRTCKTQGGSACTADG